MRMQALVAKLRQQHQNLLDLQQQEQAWAQLPNSTTIEKLKVGNLTKEVRGWTLKGRGPTFSHGHFQRTMQVRMWRVCVQTCNCNFCASS